MKLLIICVDRDNDLGSKAGINSPIIGREDCLKAAMAMGLKDPEDSDTNSMFSGISIYDDYIKNGVDAEIAIICGDMDVGIKSDTTLANQLEIVINKVEPKGAILVSDGAEDEFIYPVIASRLKIDGVKRVIVKQTRNIESGFYMFARLMQDEKVRRKFVLPLALALIVFSTFFIIASIANRLYPNADIPDIAWAIVFLTLGIYIIIKAYKLDEPIKAMSADAKTAMATIPFILLAGITLIAGILAGWQSIQQESDSLKQILTLLGILLWTGAFAIILLGMGRAMHVYSKESDFPWVFFPMVFSILAFSSFMYMAIIIISFWMGFATNSVIDDIAAFFGMGMFLLLLGYFSFSGIKEQKRETDWHH